MHFLRRVLPAHTGGTPLLKSFMIQWTSMLSTPWLELPLVCLDLLALTSTITYAQGWCKRTLRHHHN
jgi:hypothetical protein